MKPPNYGKIIETKTAKLWLGQDRNLYALIKENAEQTLKDIREMARSPL